MCDKGCSYGGALGGLSPPHLNQTAYNNLYTICFLCFNKHKKEVPTI